MMRRIDELLLGPIEGHRLRARHLYFKDVILELSNDDAAFLRIQAELSLFDRPPEGNFLILYDPVALTIRLQFDIGIFKPFRCLICDFNFVCPDIFLLLTARKCEKKEQCRSRRH